MLDTMSEFLFIVLFIAAWIILNVFVLPKLGVKT